MKIQTFKTGAMRLIPETPTEKMVLELYWMLQYTHCFEMSSLGDDSSLDLQPVKRTSD